MGFNRTKAIDYAEKYWDRPCHDGVFWLTDQEVMIERKRKELKAPAKDGWEARFIPHQDGSGQISEDCAFIRQNPAGGKSIPGMADKWDIITIHDWAGMADCAHYLSLCLQSGGAKIFSLRVHELVSKLQALPDTITVAERVTKNNGQRVIDTGIIKPGDMIGYFNVDPKGGDYGRPNTYTHSTMFVGKIDRARKPDNKDAGRVTCHSISRFGHETWNDEWWLHDHYAYTLIHFTADDSKPSPDIAKLLDGWWKIEAAGRTDYHLYAGGRAAQVTIYAPKTAKDPIKSPQDKGHCWQTSGLTAVTIFRSTGTVVSWVAIDPTKGKQGVTVNGVMGLATKMF